jgi:hypothetical protein
MAGCNMKDQSENATYGAVNVIIECEFVVGKAREWICKEFAIIDLRTKRIMCNTLQLPENLSWNDLPSLCKTQNVYLRDCIHGIWFSEGCLPYTELSNILVKACSSYQSGIYTKGLEKCNFLSAILEKPVSNLEDIPNLYTRSDLEIGNIEKSSKKRYACFHDHISSSGRIHCCLNKLYRHKSKLKKYYKM